MSNGSMDSDLIHAVKKYIDHFTFIRSARENLVKFFHFGIPDWEDDEASGIVHDKLNSLLQLLQKMQKDSKKEKSLYYKQLRELNTHQILLKMITSTRRFNTHFLQHASNMNNTQMMQECKIKVGENIKSLSKMETEVKERASYKDFNNNLRKVNNIGTIGSSEKSKTRGFATSVIENSTKQIKMNIQNSFQQNGHKVSNINGSHPQSFEQNHSKLGIIRSPSVIPSLTSKGHQHLQHHGELLTPTRKKRIPKKSKKLQENDEVESNDRNSNTVISTSMSMKEKMQRKRNTKKSADQSQTLINEKKTPKSKNQKDKKKKLSKHDKVLVNVEETQNKNKISGRKRSRSTGSNLVTATEDNNGSSVLESIDNKTALNERNESVPNSISPAQSKLRPLTAHEQAKKKDEEMLNKLKKEYLEKINDPFPNRITNPLQCLPPFPPIPNPSIDIIPNGAEFWNLIDLYFPKPRSLPISTIASILGFKVPKQQIDVPLVDEKNMRGKVTVGNTLDFDPNTVSLLTLMDGGTSSNRDPFHYIPPLGNFPQLWRNRNHESPISNRVYDGDENLDYVDTSWTRILEQYRGKKSIEEIKLATDMIHVQYEISSDCIKLACEHKLISKNIRFRFARLGDENALVEFLEKTDIDDRPTKQELTSIIKCESQKILVAESEENKLLSFIHYSFNWYFFHQKKETENLDPSSDDKALISKSPDKHRIQESSELVTLVNRIYSPENLKENDNFNLIIVLLSLTFHHSQQSNVFYTIMEAPESVALDFSKLFRMRILPKSEGSTNTVPLACDMVMISFRFTYYMMREMERERCKPDTFANQDSDVVNESMIVRLPKVKEAQLYLNSMNKEINGVNSFNINSKASLESNVPSGEKKSTIVKISVCNDPSTTSTESDCSKIPEWRVLRVYPSQTTSNNLANINKKEDSLVSKLKSLQEDILESDKKMEIHVRKLLCKVVKEEMRYSSKDYLLAEEIEKEARKEYSIVLKRRKELQLAWEAQLEQDMDAVCDVCGDGEVTISNQILFCEACNVAVHQRCYGIETIPEGDYFCKACLYFNRDEEVKSRENNRPKPLGMPAPRPAPLPLPISCELCPRKQGAFVRTDMKPEGLPRKRQFTAPPQVDKWVHVLCAKWFGLNYIDPPTCDIIEDVRPLKLSTQQLKFECILCKSNRGAVYKCSAEDCTNRMHITCSRLSGLCTIIHGTCYDGSEVENPWTMYCPEHSEIDEAPEGSTTIEQLILAAKAFPPEPQTPPQEKPFWKMNAKERRNYFSEVCKEESFFEMVTDRLEGLRCSVCNVIDNNPDLRQNKAVKDKSKAKLKKSDTDDEDYSENMLSVCTGCGLAFHVGCYSDKKVEEGNNSDIICDSCKYTKEFNEKIDFEKPQCHMCNQESGLLVKAFAKPASKKHWAKKQNAIKKTLFGKQIWCHAICGMWHPHCMYQNHGHLDKLDSVDCTNIIMADGKRHTSHDSACLLCGRSDGAKISCSHDGCLKDQNKKIRKPGYYHVSCARQAGLEVSDHDDIHQQIYFKLLCLRHAKWEFSLHARLQELLDFERSRSGPHLEKQFSPMTLSHATSLLNQSVSIMAILGWSWRWADWWVQHGYVRTRKNIPQNESSPESRCNDARKCRLAAFGAALRNREYDKIEPDNRVALVRALRAILSTPSLVGDLRKVEIEFLVDWLGRAYRYNSKLLGFGSDAIPVANEGSCLHIEDKSKKFELGNRPLPGKFFENSKVLFENVTEVDDFLQRNLKPDTIPITQRSITPPLPPKPLSPRISPHPPPPQLLIHNRKEKVSKNKRKKDEKEKRIHALDITYASVTVKCGSSKFVILNEKPISPKSPLKKGKLKPIENGKGKPVEPLPKKKRKLTKMKQISLPKLQASKRRLAAQAETENQMKSSDKKTTIDEVKDHSIPNMYLDSFQIAKKKRSK